MDFVRLPHIVREFKRTPPLHMMVAAYLGIEGEAGVAAPDPGASQASAGSLLDAFSTPEPGTPP